MNLWDYQLEAIEFIRKQKRVYLALDMGMGKTLTSLAAGEKLARLNILVIAEKNEIVNSQNFKRESEMLGMTYHSLRDEELPDTLPGEGKPHVYGVNPDALVKLDIDRVREIFDFVIVDEATMAKTTSTARFKAVKKVCKEMEYVVLLSGTPMMNGASELYAPLLLLNHPLAGNGTSEARMAFEGVFAGGHRRKIRNTGLWFQDYVWWAKGANHVRELRWLIKDQFFFRRKEDSSVFRKKTRRVQHITMSMPWLAEYTQAWDTYFQNAQTRNKNLAPGDYLEKMENITELQRLIENGQMYQINSKWKANKVVSDVATGAYGDQRVIIFTMYVETYEQIARSLEQVGVPFKTFEDVKEFKTGNDKVLLGRIKAHGKGGNVPEASVCLFVDMDFVPANNIQAENRIDRPEQKRDMTVVYYVTEGKDVVDEHVRRINQDKIRKIDEFMRPLTPEEEGEMDIHVRALKQKYSKQFVKLGV